MPRKKLETNVVKQQDETVARNLKNKGIFEQRIRTDDEMIIFNTSLKIARLPDVDIFNYDQLNDRLDEYFSIISESKLKPTVSGLAMAVGIDRQILYSIVHDNSYYKDLPMKCRKLLKKAYDFLEVNWENNFQSGKINPVTGIFLGKNHYGYQDKVEQVISTDDGSSKDETIGTIQKRYLK